MVGNKAVAYGAKLARVQVISAYPITPQTTIVQYLAEFIANGEMKARFIEVESELSAMVAVQGASFAGARVFTATSGPGLFFMHHPMMEGADLPVVMGVVHRSNKSMQPDHTDLMAQRDNGWIQLYCENNQEALDTALMSYKIAEDPRLSTPTDTFLAILRNPLRSLTRRLSTSGFHRSRRLGHRISISLFKSGRRGKVACMGVRRLGWSMIRSLGAALGSSGKSTLASKRLSGVVMVMASLRSTTAKARRR
jgi:hypothetical protein